MDGASTIRDTLFAVGSPEGPALDTFAKGIIEQSPHGGRRRANFMKYKEFASAPYRTRLPSGKIRRVDCAAALSSNVMKQGTAPQKL
jgi:hypothetical protein